MPAYMACNLPKKELLFIEDSTEYYTVAGHVGELLVDFLSLDFQSIEDLRIKIINDIQDKIEKAPNDEAKEKIYYIAGVHMYEELIDCGNSHAYFSQISDCENVLINPNEVKEYRLSYIVSELKAAIDFCCNLDFNPKLNTLTSAQRYYFFINHYNKGELFNSTTHNLKTGLAINDSSFSDELIGFLFDENFDYLIDPLSEEMISFIKTKSIEPIYLFHMDSIYDFLLFEFTKMIELNIQIKVCKNCGKYFVLKGDYATDYCDRVPDGGISTCKKIAAIRARKNKVKNNPILKEYEKAYKRMYARLSNHKISNEEFRVWSDEASIKRDSFVDKYNSAPSEDLLMQFKKYLGNK